MVTDKATALRDAEKLLRTGKLAQAIEAYERVIDADRADWEARSLLAQLHIRVGAPEKAVTCLASAADILHLAGDTSKAASHYSRVLALSADHEHALMQLGEIAAASGHVADAIARFTQVAEQRDARGDRRGAGEARIRLAEINPQDVEAHLKAARAKLEADPRTALTSPAEGHATEPVRIHAANVPVPVAQSAPVAIAERAPQASAVPASPTKPVAVPAAPSIAPAVAAVRPALQTEQRFAVATEPRQAITQRLRGMRNRAAIGGVALLLVAGGVLAGRQFFMPAAVAEANGTLTVTTNPSDVDVIIDGHARGKTPFQGTLEPGNHQLVLARGEHRRSIPLTIAAGSQVSQFVELVESKATNGRLQVRSDPPGAEVSVDGQRRGSAPITLEDLVPGVHTVTLESRIGSVTQSVTIEGGTMASLVVPMGAPQGAPVSGWIAIDAPIDVQVFENQRLLGSNRTDRIMVSIGRHELQLVNDALGFRMSRNVQVAPGQVANVKLDVPKGTMAINAQPWADVTIDGERIGETPIGSVALTLGAHEVVFRHPDLGERKHTATVTLDAPTRLSVDMRKK